MTSRALTLALALPLGLLPASAGAQRFDSRETHHEVPDDAPGLAARETSPAGTLRIGSYTSVQVNVNGSGDNIVGDAGNEPSLAVDPNNPLRMVAGWRQFDTISSNFRQAGWAYSHDGGATWTFPGKIEAGLFRSDPVLDVDNNGVFHYHSLNGNFECRLFRSTNGGVSWDSGTSAFGGDKNWMVVDRTSSPGEGHVYGIWQAYYNCCNEDTFTRSADGGSSFETPVEIPQNTSFGVIDVGPTGEVFAAGIEADSGQNFSQLVVSKSTNARDSSQTPSFTSVFVNLGGAMRFGVGPNPAGLLGQAYVRADPQDEELVYALCSTNTPGSDPLDTYLIRSEDGGQTWTAPIRVNNDPAGTNAWQWMGTLSVSPLGRIDVVWNDTRNSGGSSRLNETFYAWSWDRGETWGGNEAFTPQWDSHVGWPRQDKIGDYYDMISDDEGAHLAYATTFNGEQDVYYVNLFPDCNENGFSDVADIRGGSSADVDGDWTPDECEALSLFVDDDTPDIGQPVTLDVQNGLPASLGILFLTGVNGVPLRIRLTNVFFGADGNASFTGSVPNNPALSGVSFSMDTIALGLDGEPELSNELTLVVQ